MAHQDGSRVAEKLDELQQLTQDTLAELHALQGSPGFWYRTGVHSTRTRH